MKEKNNKIWKYITIIMTLVGIMSLIISSISAHPIEIESFHLNVDKTKDYEMTNGGIRRASIFTEFDPDELDQLQDQLEVAFRIGVGTTGCSILQPVINDREPMSGFQVIIARHGTPSRDLWFGIMYPTYGNPFDGQSYMISCSLTPAQIPNSDTYYWAGVDCSDYPLDISPGSPALGIVLMSADDPDDGNYWLWGASSTNTYPTYRPRGWNVNDEEWQNGEIDAATKDMCFATYTSTGGTGDLPEITIATTTWVSAGVGVFSLIVAAFSGTRYLGWI
jgi:hypothetical protein